MGKKTANGASGTEQAVEPRTDGEKSGSGQGSTRREFVVGAAGAAVMVGLGAGVKAFGGNGGQTMRPPGGQDEDRFMSRCTRCMRCYEACPQHVVVPASLEEGLLNLRTPSMDFHAGWCDFCKDANDGEPLCVASCPTKALDVPAGATHEDVVIGKVLLKRDWCLAYRLTHCRDCYDACEFDAIELDENKRPHLVLDKCNGCGACEYVCRSMTAGTPVAGATHRAIIVVPADQGREE